MGPTVAIWLPPDSKLLTTEDLLQIARRFDTQAQSPDAFGIMNTAVIGGTTTVGEPRTFGLALGDAGLDESELLATASLVGFTPRSAVHAFAYSNATIDHRILGEIALLLVRESDGLIDFGGTLGRVGASPGKLLTIPYEASTLAETFHVADAEFLEWWLQQPTFRMVK